MRSSHSARSVTTGIDCPMPNVFIAVNEHLSFAIPKPTTPHTANMVAALSVRKELKAFIKGIPAGKLKNFPDSPRTIHHDDNFRLDMQKVHSPTLTDLFRFTYGLVTRSTTTEVIISRSKPTAGLKSNTSLKSHRGPWPAQYSPRTGNRLRRTSERSF